MSTRKITEMGRDELLALKPRHVATSFMPGELFHIAKELGAWWSYDYISADCGRPGRHAELKSGLHSDGFFISKLLLEHENIRGILADQILRRIQREHFIYPDYVAGIPDSATSLGKEVAGLLNVTEAKMEKRDGKISLVTNIGQSLILLVEDVCTLGTGFSEAVIQIHSAQPDAMIVLCDPVLLNRGGLTSFKVGTDEYKVQAVATQMINSWTPDKCPLCPRGSEAIRPKETAESWGKLVASQLR